MKTLMMSVDPKKLADLRGALALEKDAEAITLADALIASHEIFINCCNAKYPAANRARARLMKAQLARRFASSSGKRKMFFKFGEEHLYRGFNVLRNNDLGNYVAEIADASGKQDVNILALGTNGEQLKFARMGHWKHAAYSILDADHKRFHYLKPFVESVYPAGWTLYDMRRFRQHFAAMQIADPDFERLVFGYDFLLLIPNTRADDPISDRAF